MALKIKKNGKFMKSLKLKSHCASLARTYDVLVSAAAVLIRSLRQHTEERQEG